MNKQQTIYSLKITDIYIVAQEKLDRRLSDAEVMRIADRIGEYIDWHQAIEDAISEEITSLDMEV